MKIRSLLVLMLSVSADCISLPMKRTVVITGANSGVGLAATKILAATNQWNVVMACRSIEKANSARLSIEKGIENIEVCELDLADLSSIRRFSNQWKDRSIDALACNAGVQESTSGFGGKEKDAAVKRTKQGYEVTVGTNHIGHFLLLNLFLSRLEANSGRVVIVGSGVHDPDSPGGNVGSKATLGDMSGLVEGFQDPIAMVDGSEYDPDKAYKDSKLCNVMTSLELSRRLLAAKSSVTCNVMNPGLIPTTGLFRDINPIFVFIFTILTKYVFKVAVSEEEGGGCLAYMIGSDALKGVTGGYYSAVPGPNGRKFGPTVPSKEARDEAKGRQLWALTEKLVA